MSNHSWKNNSLTGISGRANHGAMIRDLIDKSGMSQTEISLKTGISKAAVCRIYLNRQKISADQALAFNRAFGWPLSKLRPDYWPPRVRSFTE